MKCAGDLEPSGSSEPDPQRHYPSYLVLMLLTILVTPFANLSGNFLERSLLPFVADLMIFQSLRGVLQGTQGERLLGGRRSYRCLGIVTLIVIWLPFLFGHRSSLALTAAVMVCVNLFYGLTSFRILQLLGSITKVDWRTLMLASAGYVQLGLTGGKLATLLELVHPGSFVLGAMPGGEEVLQRLNYFSFVTLSSIGYGDVIPKTTASELLANVISISGVLYVSLMMGIVLSRYVSSETEAGG